MRKSLILSCLLFTLVVDSPQPVEAGAFATEVTQLLNHAQLILSYIRQGTQLANELNMYADSWHTQGWWALVFAVVAVLFGAGALLLPRITRGGRTPGWGKAAATGAIIVGLVGVLLAVLTVAGVFGGHLTAPTSAG